MIKNKKSDAVITITDVEYPPYWMFKKDKKKLIPLIHGSNKFTRRQDTPKALKPAGLVYALRTNFLRVSIKFLFSILFIASLTAPTPGIKTCVGL